MRIVGRAASSPSENKLLVRRRTGAGTPYRRESDGMVSLDGSRKWSTSGEVGCAFSLEEQEGVWGSKVE